MQSKFNQNYFNNRNHCGSYYVNNFLC